MKKIIPLLLLLTGCAGFHTNVISRCPVCWWLVQPINTTTYPNGDVVTTYACLDAACGWQGSATNHPQFQAP